jgi:hypothetical protein
VVGCIHQGAAFFVAGRGNVIMQATASSQEALTFVVRLWREADAEGHDHWRGRVEHMASQEVGYVENVADLTGFIERWIGGERGNDEAYDYSTEEGR